MDSEYEKIQLNKITHSVRASQAVLQYGVGAMVDFPEQTLMTAAPETWEGNVVEIHDERLEKVLHVDFFGMPGSKDDGRYQSGIAYARFPECCCERASEEREGSFLLLTVTRISEATTSII